MMYPHIRENKKKGEKDYYMRWFDKVKEKATEVTEQFFDSEEELDQQPEEIAEPISTLSLPENMVDENIQQTAEEILQEAVAELDQVEDTIYAVKDCIETMGQDSDPAIITKMITKVAKLNPEILKQDGENRLTKIEEAVNEVKASSQKALEEATNYEKQIREAENESESSYTSDVSELNSRCEEEIMQLRLKLQEDIEARGKRRDQELENLRKQKEESKAERSKIEALRLAVEENAARKQAEIELYLSKLQVEA